jgi:hypothetical protein
VGPCPSSQVQGWHENVFLKYEKLGIESFDWERDDLDQELEDIENRLRAVEARIESCDGGISFFRIFIYLE